MGRQIRKAARGKLLDPIPLDDYKLLRAQALARTDNSYFIRDLCTRGVVLTFTTANYAKCFVILHMLFNDGPKDFIRQVCFQRRVGALDQTPLDALSDDKPLALTDKASAQLFVPYFAYLRARLVARESYGCDFIRAHIDNSDVTLASLLKPNLGGPLPVKYVDAVSSLLDMANLILKVAPCPDLLYPTLSRDLTAVFTLLSDGLITILSVFTSMSLVEAGNGLLIYKSFVALNVTSHTSQYLNMTVPQIDETLIKTMESWLRSEQLARAPPLPASPPESCAESFIQGSPKSAKSTQIISTISHRQFQRNPSSAGLQEPTSVSLSPPKSVYSVRSSSLRSHRKNNTAISFDFSETVTQNVSRFKEEMDEDEDAPQFPICNSKLSDRTITRYLTQDSDDASTTTTECSPTFVITSTPPKSLTDSDELLDCFNDPECEPSPKMSMRKMRPPQLNLTRDVHYDDNVGIAFLKSASSDSSDWSQIFSPLENDAKVHLSFSPSPSTPPVSSMGLAVGYPETATSAGSTNSQKKWKRFFSRH